MRKCLGRQRRIPRPPPPLRAENGLPRRPLQIAPADQPLRHDDLPAPEPGRATEVLRVARASPKLLHGVWQILPQLPVGPSGGRTAQLAQGSLALLLAGRALLEGGPQSHAPDRVAEEVEVLRPVHGVLRAAHVRKLGNEFHAAIAALGINLQQDVLRLDVVVGLLREVEAGHRIRHLPQDGSDTLSLEQLLIHEVLRSAAVHVLLEDAEPRVREGPRLALQGSGGDGVL
mmetsp:Transcript_51098/g.158411  ORF Transcript_51098/g.158411 Transcript_51098/m.158411 type:complete len:230 (+) Transcript_51098:679-1368(+)